MAAFGDRRKANPQRTASGFQRPNARNRTRIAQTTSENRMSENGQSSTPSTAVEVPKKRKRSAYGAGGKNRFRRNLKKNESKYIEREGRSFAAAAGTAHTQRAVERGGVAVAQKALVEKEQELVESRQREAASAAGCSMAEELARESTEALKEEKAKREEAERSQQEAERRQHEAERDKEKAEAGRRRVEDRNREMNEELTRLRGSAKKLRSCVGAGCFWFCRGSSERSM